jgi:hypothetical protein
MVGPTLPTHLIGEARCQRDGPSIAIDVDKIWPHKYSQTRFNGPDKTETRALFSESQLIERRLTD